MARSRPGTATPQGRHCDCERPGGPSGGGQAAAHEARTRQIHGRVRMKIYTGEIIQTDQEWLVADGGDPPRRGEIVEVNGRKARVTRDRNDLVFDTMSSTDKFLIRFQE